MAIKLIDGPQILVSELPVSLAVDDDAPYRRSYLELPEPHAYRRLFGVLNACTVDPFLTEFWLNNSKPSGLSVLVARDIRVLSDLYLFSGGELFMPNEEMPGYLEHIVAQGDRAARLQELCAQSPDGVIEQAFIISHCNCKIYGHFLVEVLPKLAIVKRYYDSGLRIPIVLGSRDPSFMAEIIKTALPEAEIIVLSSDRGVLIRNCLLPSQCHMYLLNAHHNAFLNELIANCNDQCSDIEFPEKVLISREGISDSFRSLANWGEIEHIAGTFGYTVVQPELLPMVQQVCLFSRARAIVGEYGSALHNAIFAREARCVVALNWINLVQQAIGLARGHSNIFIFPEGGQPILAPALSTVGPIVNTQYAVPSDLVVRALEFADKP